jgi:hypothetical protein
VEAVSGNTIGGIAGGLIGFAIGGPAGAQWGWMIGSVVGGIVDPQVIQGAQWQNQQLQGSADGLGRAVIFGTATVTGNLLDAEPGGPRIGKKTEGGKGGPEVERDTAILTYAIEICDSSELRGTKVNSVIAVWEDEKLVYDVRPDSDGVVDPTRAATSAKWAENKKFYFGGEDQMPPPELQAIHGSGNVPAYRGSCIMVVHDEDLMVDIDDKPRGRIPTYRFLVSACEPVEITTPVRWDADTKTGDEADVIELGFTFRGLSNGAGYVQADRSLGFGNWYWETTTGWWLSPGSGINHFGASGIYVTLTGATGLVIAQLTFGGSDGGAVFTNSLGADTVLYPGWIPPPGVSRSARIRHHLYWDQVVGGTVVWKVAIDNGPWTQIMSRGAALVGNVIPYAMSRGTYLDGGIYEKNVTIYSMPEDLMYEIPAGAKALAASSTQTYLVDKSIPDSPGYYVDGDGNVIGPSVPVGVMCGAPLDQVVRKLHKLGAPQLSDAEFDLEPLEGDIVRGYAIQDAAVTVAEACDPLRRVWTFDLPSYDGKIHAIKRGRDVDWTLPEDDLIAMDSDYEQSMQDDTVSLPRKLHLAYNDLNIDYKETTQISERYSTDVRVVGEEKISMGQLVMSATEAKQAVVKQHKLAWLNAEDTRTLSAPLEYIGAVNSDIVQFRGRRYRVDQMRVEGLQVTFESAAYDRASSYQSTAVGTEGVPPPPMGAALRGPTVSVFMNLPVLRDADDKAGIYWAASGLLEGWRGALLQMSRDGTTFENLNIAVPTPCTIGTLQAGILSASRYGMDEVNQIMVKLNPLSPGLDSTDMDGLLREANSAAILYADGTAEIVQFLTAVETAPREYTLSGLLRGRLDTTPGTHNAGAWFVLLNDAIRFVPLRNDDVGATITFRAMSAGTVAENNDSAALTLGSFKSLAEWEPTTVRAVTGTGEVSVTWAGRGRLGSSRMPVHSLNFKEYRATVDGGHTAVTTAQAVTVPAPGITEPYTTTVAALSRIASQFDSAEGT